MKPIKKIKQIEIWDCGIKCHEHMTEDIAMRCIEKHEGSRRLKEHPAETKVRHLLASRAILNGATYLEASKLINVTAGHVKECLRKTIVLCHELNESKFPKDFHYTHVISDINLFRKNKDFWDERFDELTRILNIIRN